MTLFHKHLEWNKRETEKTFCIDYNSICSLGSHKMKSSAPSPSILVVHTLEYC